MEQENDSVPDSHLQNPIRPHNRRLFQLAAFDSEKKSIPMFIQELFKNSQTPYHLIDTNSEKLYGVFFKDVYDDQYPILPWVEKHLPPIWDRVLTHLTLHNPNTHKMSNSNCFQNYDLTVDILRLFSTKQHWEGIRITMQKLRMRNLTTWSHISNSPSPSIETIKVSQGFALIKLRDDDTQWLFDYDQIMMLCDIIIGRIFSCIYMELLPSQIKYKVDHEVLVKIFSIIDTQFKDWGNNTYDLIKNFEAIVQGVILDRFDPLDAAGDFLKTLVRNTDEKFLRITQKLIELLNADYITKEQLCELFGMNRLWGHPTVDEDAGCKKIKEISDTRMLPDIKTMQDSKAMFIRHFCIQFINMHGRWPRLNISGLDWKRALHQIIKSHKTIVNFYSSRFTLEDWGKLEFEKEFEFDYKPDYTQMCDDKAISPYLYDLPVIYAPEVLGYKPAKPKSSRRVLLELLRKEEIDIKGICDMIQRREVPESFKIVLLSAKERELKIAPRLFAMFVLEIRLYYNITEANLSKTIFKYFPQQTMTLSEDELTKRVLSMSTNDTIDANIPIYMSIDFKSWNIHWQYASTYEIFNQVDRLFGTLGLYTYSHIFFQECTIALSSRYNPPSSVIGKENEKVYKKKTLFAPGERLWRDHRGGFEGIRQKGWTIITIVLLLIVEMLTGVKSLIIGQGDNQFLKLMIPVETHATRDKNTYITTHQIAIKEELTRFLNILNNVSEKFKLVIKTEESWFSSNFVNYGKDLLIDGAYQAQGIKRVSRIMPDINDVYPTLSTKIASMQTTGLSTAQKSMDYYVPYFLCQVETLMMINRDMICPLLPNITYLSKHKEWAQSESGQQFILHANTNCMSFPMLNLYDYLFRGHPDPLSTYLSLLYNNLSHCIWCKSIYLWLQEKKFELGPGKADLLINDPLSLNVKSPQLSSHIFKDEIFKKVKTLVKNKALKEIFRTTSEKEDNEIYSYLITLLPVYPRLLHELLQQTVTATRLTFISKFSSARTISQMLTTQELSTFYYKVLKSEINMINHWISISHSIQYCLVYKENNAILCPTQLAKTLRDYTWGETLNYNKIEGVTIPHPIHQFSINLDAPSDHASCIGQNEYITFSTITKNWGSIPYSRGPYQPYLGQKTKEKQSGKIFQISEASRPQKAAERLLQLYQWCLNPTSSLTHFIQQVISTRTDIPWDVISLTSTMITSGCQTHRLNDHFTSRGVLQNGRPNTSSFIYLSTDTMGKYGKNSENVNIHFQSALLTGIALLTSKILHESPIEKDILITHMHYQCKTCEERIPDIKVTAFKPSPIITPYMRNPLIYAQSSLVTLSPTPESMSLRLISSDDPSVAIAFIIFSKILTNINTRTWGTSQTNKVFSSKISLRVINNIGLSSILDYLAIIIYLYYGNNCKPFLDMSCTLTTDVWQDLGPICVTPDLIQELFLLSGRNYQPQLFTGKLGYSRMLNQALIRKLRDVNNIIHRKGLNIVFYIVPGCSLSKLFNMWANLLFALSRHTVDITSITRDLIFEERVGCNYPSKDAITTLDNTIMNSYSADIPNWCWSICPLKLSKVGPECVAGYNIALSKPKKSEKKGILRTMRPSWYNGSTFPIMLELSLPERYVENVDSLIVDDIATSPLRKYDDHMYHLYEQMSSAYLKILQIILVFNITIDEPVVCLADGEGSISNLLHKLSGQDVYFNTLVDTGKLIPHRGTSYVPGEMIEYQQSVKSADLSALYGGDLLDENYVDNFMKRLPDSVSMVTFDAENPGGFMWKSLKTMLINTLRICIRTKSKNLIFKTFINSIQSVSRILSIINTVYDNIFIVVPIFSSNESYEIYLLAQGYSPIVTIDTVGLYQTQLWRSIRVTLTTLQNTRLTNQPHMVVENLWKDLLREAKRLGFPLSWKRQLGRLTYFLTDILDNELINELDRLQYYFVETVIVTLRGIQSSMGAGYISLENQLLLSCNQTYRKTLEVLIRSLIHISIVKSSITVHKNSIKLNNPSDYTTTLVVHNANMCDTIDNMTSFSHDNMHIHFINKLNLSPKNYLQKIYTYHYTYQTNEPDVLKSMWAIYGCSLYKDEIM